MVMSPFVLAGVAGFCFYAGSFGLVQLGRLDGNGVGYTSLNTIGASLVLVSMLDQFSLSALLTSVTWIGIGLFGLARRLRPGHVSGPFGIATSPAASASPSGPFEEERPLSPR